MRWRWVVLAVFLGAAGSGLEQAFGQMSRLPAEHRGPFQAHLQQHEDRLVEQFKRGQLTDAAFLAENVAGKTAILHGADDPLTRLARARADDFSAMAPQPPAVFRAARRESAHMKSVAIRQFRMGNRDFGSSFLIAMRTKDAEIYGVNSLIFAEHELGRGQVLQHFAHDDAAMSFISVAWKTFSWRLGETHPFASRALVHRALCHRQLRDYDAAIAELSKAVGHLEPYRDRWLIDWIVARKNLGDCYRESGNFPKAESELHELLMLADRENDVPPAILTEIENSLGLTAQARGDLLAANAWFQRAMESAASANNSVAQRIHVLSNFGLNLMAQGRYADAEAKFQESLRLAEARLGPRSAVTATVINNLATWAHQKSATSVEGDFEKLFLAESLYRKAFEIRREILSENHPDVAHPLINLGVVQIDLGNIKQAEESFEKALEMTRRQLGDEHPDTAICMRWLAITHNRQERFAEARSVLQQVLKIRLNKRGIDHPETVEAFTDLAWTCFYQGEIGAAYQYCTKAAKSFHQARQRIAEDGLGRAFKASEQSPLSLLALLELRQHRPLAAWEVLEESFAAGLLEDFQDRDGMTLASNGERRRIPLPELQAALAEDSAFLAWLDVPLRRRDRPDEQPSEHWAVIVKKSGLPLWIDLTTDANWSLDDEFLAENLGRLVADRQPMAQITYATNEVHEQRWVPIVKALSQQGEALPGHLIVLPSPGMRGLPIDLLVGPDTTISYAPSSTVWQMLTAKLHRSQESSPRLLALGNPTFELPKTTAASALGAYDPLPGSALEVSLIRHLFEGKSYDVTEMTGDAATESRLHQLAQSGELSSFGCLHLATHGEPDADRPMLSRLICSRSDLAGRSGDEKIDPSHDSLLTAGEVLSQWKLDADLVTLSACDSALGRFAGGEGYVGLSQAFLLAGAKSILVSQWKVNDEATALLMARFYENVLGTRGEMPMTKVEALHEAKNWLRRVSHDDRDTMLANWRAGKYTQTNDATGDRDAGPFGSPSEWAAFILVGDTGPLLRTGP